jgi:hypothetical protein
MDSCSKILLKSIGGNMKEPNLKKFDLDIESLEMEKVEERNNLAMENCFGTLGTAGTIGGCAGTAGTFGCCG